MANDAIKVILDNGVKGRPGQFHFQVETAFDVPPELTGKLLEGKFTFPPVLREAAQKRALEIYDRATERGVDLASCPEWEGMKKLPNTKEGIGAYLLAMSMASSIERRADGSLAATFDGKLNKADYQTKPELVLELAQQILRDNGLAAAKGITLPTAPASPECLGDLSPPQPAGKACTPAIER